MQKRFRLFQNKNGTFKEDYTPQTAAIRCADRNQAGKSANGPLGLFLWTDSTISLRWIKGSSKQWKSFAAKRVLEIQRLSEPPNWNQRQSKEKPADRGTRGIKSQTLIVSHCFLWLFCSGPPTRSTSFSSRNGLRLIDFDRLSICCSFFNPSVSCWEEFPLRVLDPVSFGVIPFLCR